MYQGAHAKQQGAERRSNANGSSRKPRRRRTNKKKKNPSPVTWVLIAGASAAAVGGGIAYALYRRKKKAAALPPGNGEVPPTNGKPTKPTTKPPKGKINAPEFPYSTSEAKAIEGSWAVAFVAENLNEDATGVTKSVNAITDDAFYEIYKIRKIPAKSERGTGWQPYIDSWLRIRDSVKFQVDQLGG